MKKLIINLVPTGMVPSREMTPHVPISPQEIVADVLKCAGLGASMVHLHARDAAGSPSCDRNIYAEIIAGIRAVRPDLVIVASTSGRTFNEIEKRTDILTLEGDLKPDMASLTLGSMNFRNEASINSPDVILKLIDRMNERGIKPELEVFDVGMINYARYLIDKGLLRPPYYFNIILGNIAGAQAKLLHLGMLVNELPPDACWAVAAIGNCLSSMLAAGVGFAPAIRVGIEDNIWFDDARAHLATNGALVERVVRLASVLDRPIASPHDVRRILRLPDRGQRSGGT